MITKLQTVNENITTGAQPSKEDFQSIKEQGFDAVVNLSPDNTKNYIPEEKEIIGSLGLEYYYHPIDCTVLEKSQYENFVKLMKSLGNKKIFCHCGGNIKSSGFIHLYRFLELGENSDKAWSDLQELDVHDEKWFKYFQEMGLKIPVGQKYS